MTPMLYILGMSHPLQCGAAECPAGLRATFEADLRKVCASHDIRRVAEEMSKEGLDRYGVTETIGQRIAKELKFAYCGVDLNREERQELCLDDTPVLTTVMNHELPGGNAAFRQAFDELVDEVRERCWTARLLAENNWPTLFICGANHVKCMARLWRSLGLYANVIQHDYEP